MMIWTFHVTLLLIGGILLSSPCATEQYYVTPTDNQNPACPSGKPCHTLNYYASNTPSLLNGKGDIELLFLDGVHYLTENSLEINDTVYLLMSSDSNSSKETVNNPKVIIHVGDNVQISVDSINFTMENLCIMGYAQDEIALRVQHVLILEINNLKLINSLIWIGSEVQKIPNSLHNLELTRPINKSSFGKNVEQTNLTQTSESAVYWKFSNCWIGDTQFELVNVPTIVDIYISDSYVENSELGLSTFAGQPEEAGNIYFRNVTFKRCPSLVIVGKFNTNVTIDNCSFIDGGSKQRKFPIQFASVDLYFSGMSLFSNNVGYRGGALNLLHSTMHLKPGSNITFLNNTATDVGGAIYITKLRTDRSFYQLTYNIDKSNGLQSSITFINNSAQNGGSNIYGAFLKNLYPVTPNGQTQSYEIESELFYFDNRSTSELSSVSSDPTRVCLCEDGKPQCTNYSYIVQERKYTSGEEFRISLVLVGGDFGTVTGGVYAVIDPATINSLSPGQNLQQLSNIQCSSLKYSVHSRQANENIILYLVSRVSRVVDEKDDSQYVNKSIITYKNYDLIDGIMLVSPIFLNITIQECPLGFILDDSDLPTCTCNEQLTENGIDECIVRNGTGLVYRDGTTWVSHSGSENDSVLVHRYCPYDYCKTNRIGVDLYTPDNQCIHNRTGILCGGCPANLSLALGSSRCLSCTNDSHIALLLVFIVAGIALVLFIKLLHLTVEKGTINGLVLYANIIWINQSIFFPLDRKNSGQGALSVLRVFIAWLNLDFGIETCFFRGLDAYWKTWLQFVFPLYVWMLAGMIIIACHYSHRATKLFGSNSVHVLATLLLLSYVKLLRTIITSLGFVILYYPDKAHLVWLLDGNIPYFGLRHSFLFVAALLALLFLWLPYTATILLVPCLRKNANIAWINKLKPFYDVYYGPLKDKHHYWVGATLLLRVVLAVIAIITQAIAPMINILLVAIVSAVLGYLVNLVYKKSLVSILETSSLLNLTVLSTGFLYSSSQDVRIVLTCISVGVSLITFLGIVTAHAYLELKKSYRVREYENIDEAPCLDQRLPTQSVVSINKFADDCSEFREPILDSPNLYYAI